MGSEWQLRPINDFVSLAQGFAINAKTRHAIKSSGDLPLLRITDLINDTASQFIDIEDIHSKFVASDDELIYTRTGRVGLVFKEKVGVVHNNCFKIKPRPSLDRDFLFWFLRQQYVVHYVNSIASGSVQKDLNHASFLTLELPVPSLQKQKSIAHILGSLDDKIELNRQMNATLEAMAQALFKSWFVDFDPVIDNALAAGNTIPEPLHARAQTRKALGNKRKPLPEAIQKQFPNSFVFNEEMGWLPEGWEVAQIKDKADLIQYGLTTSASDASIGPRFLRITDIRGGKVNWDEVPYCEASGSDINKYKINDGDIFVARTGASTGENVYMTNPLPAVFASYLVRFVFKNHSVGRVVGMYMRTRAYFAYVEGAIGGSAQPNASAQVLASSSMIFPSNQIAEQFYKTISLYDQKNAKGERQSASLTQLRDALLPKLLSGKLRVPDAEKLMAEAL